MTWHHWRRAVERAAGAEIDVILGVLLAEAVVVLALAWRYL